MDGGHLVTRRDVVKGGAAAITLASAGSVGAPGFAADGNTVTGVVFEDLSGTGTRQPGDPGIARVLVSNGRDIARTDRDGRYTLPMDDQAIIFVVKPTGYAPPIEAGTMLPRFYYIHQPNGTPPALRYRGIDPTGLRPASLDFALTRAEEPSRFDVLLLTDPHAESTAAIDFIRTDVVSGLIGTDAAFGITAGDIMFDDLAFYDRYNRIIGEIGIPWHNIAGNHDLNFDAPDRTYALETFKRTFGPAYYAFEYGGALFLMLDNVDYLGKRKYRGRFGERQLGFVAQVLRETPVDRLVVAAMHIPLRCDLDPEAPANNTSDCAELLDLMGDRPCFSFSGHMHTTEHHYLDRDGRPPHHHHVMTTVAGSWWSGPYDHRGIAVADSPDGNPNGFHVLSVDGNRYTTRFQPAKEPATRQMRIVLDRQVQREATGDTDLRRLFGSPIFQDQACATDVIVNVFDGGPRTVVEYRIGERAPVRMERVRRPDPFVKGVFARHQDSKKSWVTAEPCTHLFASSLPADLEVGTHRIMVCARDEYGREQRDYLVVEVIGT
jgi:hypothetical protein